MRVCSFVLCHGLAVIILVGTLVPIGLGQDCPVSTILRVLDKQAQPVMNATAGQLKAEINGSRANISSLFPAAKTGVILMLDASGSMKGTWNQSIAAAKELVGLAGEDIATFIFDERIRGHAIGRTESEKLLHQWAAQTPTLGSAVYDAMIDIASRVTTRNAAIVVISDGDDDISWHTNEETKSLFLRSSWPPVFGLILDNGQSKRRDYFKKISAATGGLAIYPSSASKIPAATEELAAMVLNSFDITLQSSRPITAGAKLKLQVLEADGADGKLRRDVHALYPVEVAGCDSRPGTPAAQR
ncbi:MAG TPA: VWA domain-containing protein [Terriglobales bacterium]|nr:VWA domain-containing protein [Terriglobales bacterium]